MSRHTICRKNNPLNSISLILLCIPVLVILTSCSILSPKNSVCVETEEESNDFVTAGLPFYGSSNEVDYVIYVRFYEDNLYIPYISVKYFLQDMAGFSLQGFSYSDGKYKYENKIEEKSFPLVIDINEDSIYCPEWIGFITKTSESQKESNRLREKFLYIIKTFTGQKSRTFDLSAYGMNVYGGTDDAYVPLCVMSLLFATSDYRQYVFNGEGIYFVNADATFPYRYFSNSRWYKNVDESIAVRPDVLIESTYNMLCFTHDNFYGKPGYYGFADNGTGYADRAVVDEVDSLCLDDLLEQYDEETRILLKSSSYMDYAKGMVRLIYYVYGDCHSALNWKNHIPFTVEQRQELTTYAKQIMSNKAKKYESLTYDLTLRRIEAGKSFESDDNPKGIPVAFEVLSGGKTAVLRFDSFEYYPGAWNAFYSKEKLSNGDIPHDTMGLFYNAFNELLNNETYATVENVILDLSCNTGGDQFACQKALSYILGRGDMLEYDCQTDTKYHEYVFADLNLDGEIDDKDDEFYARIKKFHFAVLTSFLSFSCGNAFPNICYDSGIPIIGERSGGGSCFVAKACTADGFPYQYSGNFRISHKDWTDVESGAPVTKELSYEQFYNDISLQSVMDELILQGYYK